MTRRQPEIGDVVRIISNYGMLGTGCPQQGDLGVVVDYERDGNNLWWWIVQTFNGGRDGYTPYGWDEFFEIIEEK